MAKKKHDTELPYTVFQRHDAGTYGMRFSIEGHGQIKVPLKTTDQDEAYRRAHVRYIEISHDARNGQFAGKNNFKRIALDHVADLYAKVSNAENKERALANARYAERTVDRFLIPYFDINGNVAITAIGEKDLFKYVAWRQTYWTVGPGKDISTIEYLRGPKKLFQKVRHVETKLNTIQRESVTLRAIFGFAARNGYMRAGDIPKLPTDKATDKRRPHFTKLQVKHLQSVGNRRIYEKNLGPKILFERKILLNYISIAVASGMRTIEMTNLNWEHIEGLSERQAGDDNAVIKIVAKGKGKSPTQLIPQSSVAGPLENLQIIYQHTFGKKVDPTDPVFMTYNGERLLSINKSLNALLEEAKLKTNSDDERFSAYCFRHSYATWQLQKNPPMDYYTLALNMRTSIAMIQKYYGHVVPGDHHERLSENDPLENIFH